MCLRQMFCKKCDKNTPHQKRGGNITLRGNLQRFQCKKCGKTRYEK
jgi:NAD-dependent SIR2 family protein deacetylase